MELKRLKTQLGEPLKWTDYLSLPFTQNVRVPVKLVSFKLHIIVLNKSSCFNLCTV